MGFPDDAPNPLRAGSQRALRSSPAADRQFLGCSSEHPPGAFRVQSASCARAWQCHAPTKGGGGVQHREGGSSWADPQLPCVPASELPEGGACRRATGASRANFQYSPRTPAAVTRHGRAYRRAGRMRVQGTKMRAKTETAGRGARSPGTGWSSASRARSASRLLSVSCAEPFAGYSQRSPVRLAVP